MMKIRNSRQYHDALARVEQLERQRGSAQADFMTRQAMNELLALGAELDQFELRSAEPRDYVKAR